MNTLISEVAKNLRNLAKSDGGHLAANERWVSGIQNCIQEKMVAGMGKGLWVSRAICVILIWVSQMKEIEVGKCIVDDGAEKLLARYGNKSCPNTWKSSIGQY